MANARGLVNGCNVGHDDEMLEPGPVRMLSQGYSGLVMGATGCSKLPSVEVGCDKAR